ncbi:peptide chain release factor N(5)-glutamine methyltransferase [Buchnera aphidicola]|uniref:peptide chain release factor N(5)-glutamine methyltransferase n=1 Tax=Buchnera aphidicola (Cinara cf. splendens/pseudotsugae 3390) TaxID=2518980 RepID=A0A451CX35_9GAMM|nr:peptide chain release factor N(5)-glutamine methyltransferase [Buchnera aphidicola]VFP77690.1 Release factor glutamine methyltransferase [Buchnera aphidicola (Cinara cf. splendens/pseudotsugae 3390)]
MNIKTWLCISKKKLINSLTPQLDSEILICYVLKYSKKKLFLNYNTIINCNDLLILNHLLYRRILGEPIAYIINKKEFWSLSLFVSPSVLIPRPDTELLIELVMSHVYLRNEFILDLGTGSGSIALALAYEYPLCKIIGIDNSLSALSIAKYNARKLNINNVFFMYSDWFSHVPLRKFYIIVCNPPYLSRKDFYKTTQDLVFEPYNSLVSGTCGIECIQHIITNAYRHLTSIGWLYIEHCYKQTNVVRKIFKNNFFIKISSVKDYSNRKRVTFGCLLKK